MLALLIFEGGGVVVKSGLECTFSESDEGFFFTIVLSFYCSLVNYSYGFASPREWEVFFLAAVTISVSSWVGLG